MSFFTEVLSALFGGSGFAALPTDWRQVIMIAVACLLLYLGIGKGFEPLLLVPIAFGMLLANLPGSEIIHMEYFIAPADAVIVILLLFWLIFIRRITTLRAVSAVISIDIHIE